ncbi:sulfotransferase [Salibacteraceae bacterium]|nr:sulfotransferase [Salibacteraceae bacterium]
MSQSTEIIFITGSGRSGTNILKKIFSQHPDMASLPFEYRFTIDPDGVLDFYNSYPASWSPYGADHKIKRLETFLLSLADQSDEKRKKVEASKSTDKLLLSGPAYAGWELDKHIPGYSIYVKGLIHDLTSFKHPGIWPGTKEGIENNEMYFSAPQSKEALKPIIRSFLKKCFDAICQDQKKPILQEDNTHNLLYAGDLLSMFPEGKMIHIIRDPRDVISSLKSQRWAPNNINDLVAWYSAVMSQWQTQKSQLDSTQFKEIRFENLIDKPEKTVHEICGFLGIEYHSRLLEIDLSKHNIGRYKNDLTAPEISAIETGTAELLQEYNYN